MPRTCDGCYGSGRPTVCGHSAVARVTGGALERQTHCLRSQCLAHVMGVAVIIGRPLSACRRAIAPVTGACWNGRPLSDATVPPHVWLVTLAMTDRLSERHSAYHTVTGTGRPLAVGIVLNVCLGPVGGCALEGRGAQRTGPSHSILHRLREHRIIATTPNGCDDAPYLAVFGH